MLVYKCRRNEASAYLVEMLHPVVPSSRYNLRSESEKMYDFDIPMTRPSVRPSVHVLLTLNTYILYSHKQITGLSDNIRTYLSPRLARFSVHSIPFFFIGMVALFTNLNTDVTSASLFLQLAFDVVSK